ncbi:MAG TPA: MFS transporter [Acidobacteriota bacterium]|nr:MFS transporter [Acidobacteriota bacterium]
MGSGPRSPGHPPGKGRAVGLLCVTQLMGMSVWFSASAVVPALAAVWGLSSSGQAWLTMSVQLGFVAGTLMSAVLNVADRVAARWLFAVSAFAAGTATLAVAGLASGPAAALALRFATGLFLAGVYPVGMKIMATWTREDRGFGIGLLVGALTLGSATPHLIKAFGRIGDWRAVLLASGGLAIIGGLIAAVFVREGPDRAAAPRFDWKFVGAIWRDRPVALANLGYFGHMWELYAAWTWVPVFLVASFGQAGVDERWAAAAGFAFIAAGGAGSLVAGRIADRVGRTAVTAAAMAVSGACSLLAGLLFGGAPGALTVLCLVWGFAVVADSAQFSAGVSELAPPDRIGTALTLQTSLGFLLTMVTIRLVPVAERLVTWRWAFAFLALGPAAGIWAMLRLRRLPGAARMASGRR